jgi:hypothetical protein
MTWQRCTCVLHDLLGKLEYLHEWFFAGLALLGDAVEVDRIFI